MNIPDCRKCPRLVESRKQIVSGYGTCKNGIMIVAEAPGQNGANQTGIPLSSDMSGKFLQNILDELGIKKEDCYTTNAVKCSPAGNRKPSAQECSNCRPYLKDEIMLYKPHTIIIFGKIARESLMGKNSLADEIKYVQLVYDTSSQVNKAMGIEVYTFHHPAYYLRFKRNDMYDEYRSRIKAVLQQAKTIGEIDGTHAT